jgi:hypothetical protein
MVSTDQVLSPRILQYVANQKSNYWAIAYRHSLCFAETTIRIRELPRSSQKRAALSPGEKKLRGLGGVSELLKKI